VAELARNASIARIQEELTTIARRGTARVRRENEALSLVDRTMLAYIAANPGCRAVEIAAHFQHNRSTVSRQLRALMDFGLVTSGAPAGNGRGQVLTLTEAGEGAIRASSETLLAALNARLADWPSDDVEAFARMMERYNNHT
jgi:DNA-binding MarR family transcriptional regulator